MISMDLGKSLRLAIAHRNMKTKDIAVIAGVTPSYISMIANNKTTPSLSIIMKICEEMDYKLSEFIALGE